MFFVLVHLLSCAGCDGQKAHLHVTAEIKSDDRRSSLERGKGEIALLVKGDISDIFTCLYYRGNETLSSILLCFLAMFLNVRINMEQPSYITADLYSALV